MPPVEIIEVSPRDGLQNHPAELSTADKVALVLRAEKAGARRVEAVSFVNPRAVPRMADAEAVMAGLDAAGVAARGVRTIGLVVNRRGLDRALRTSVDEVNFVVVASDAFNLRNQGATTAETLREIEAAAPVVRSEGRGLSVTIGASFGCPFEGEVEEARLLEVVQALAGAGVEEIALADTIGVGDPYAVERRVGLAAAAAPKARLRLHLHNTRNTGIANAYAGYRAGVRCFDASLGGVGGCPFAPAATGNVPTEDLVYMFHRMGLATGYDLDATIAAARWLADALGGEPLPGMLMRAGGFPARAA